MKFRKSQIARVLELRVAGRSVRDIAKRTGVHYSYVCRLTKNAALPKLSAQYMSERARRACIILLEREESELLKRLDQVVQSLARFRAGPPTVDDYVPFRLTDSDNQNTFDPSSPRPRDLYKKEGGA